MSGISSKRARNVPFQIKIILEVQNHSLDIHFTSFITSQLEVLWWVDGWDTGLLSHIQPAAYGIILPAPSDISLMVWSDYLHGNRGKEPFLQHHCPAVLGNSHLWFSVSTVAASTKLSPLLTDPFLPLQLQEKRDVLPVTKGEASDNNPLKEHRCCNFNSCGHVYKITTTLLSVCTDCSSVHLWQTLPLCSSSLPRCAQASAVSGSMRSPQECSSWHCSAAPQSILSSWALFSPWTAFPLPPH